MASLPLSCSIERGGTLVDACRREHFPYPYPYPFPFNLCFITHVNQMEFSPLGGPILHGKAIDVRYASAAYAVEGYGMGVVS